MGLDILKNVNFPTVPLLIDFPILLIDNYVQYLAYLSGPPWVSQSGVELEKFFECGFMASDDAYGSYKTYGKVRLKFGPL